MIKSHEGQLSIEGNKAQVLLDFDHIYIEMMNIAPEIVQAVVMHHQDDLLSAKVDSTGFAICEKILDSLATIESEDEDDESSIL